MPLDIKHKIGHKDTTCSGNMQDRKLVSDAIKALPPPPNSRGFLGTYHFSVCTQIINRGYIKPNTAVCKAEKPRIPDIRVGKGLLYYNNVIQWSMCDIISNMAVFWVVVPCSPA
jgi:hypothetical protein